MPALPISRRTLLKGLGTAIALPWLEAMTPISLAAPLKKKPPLRMAFLYVPNGKHMPDWTPKETGKNYVLPPTLEPLAKVKDDLMILSGLTCDKARANGDGPGDHARAMAAFLTCSQPRKTNGADIKAGVSVDQVAAQKVGHLTKFPSLEIGCDKGMLSGNCDSGYSCAYSATLSWRSEATPNPKEINPRLLFERLFGGEGNEADVARAKRDQYNQSVLDFAMEDARSLRNQLGANDRRKLDEYLSSIREVESRIAKASNTTPAAKPGLERPTGIPREYIDHLRLMSDLMILAFQTDSTRIVTFAHANEGSNRAYRNIEVPEGHHDLSHHLSKPEKQAKIAKINRFHTEQLAYLLEKMKTVREGEGSLLDHSLILYGSGIGDGNRHNHDNLPVLLAGKANGAFKPGRHLRYGRDKPLADLHVSLLNTFGVPVEKFGDSKGRIEDLG
jgi:hypothetical protein